MENLNKPTLAERLKSVTQNTNIPALLTLYTEDYFTGLDAVMGIGYFSVIYGTAFHRYDPNSAILLTEMVDKAMSFVPEKKAELLHHLLIEPFYILSHLERG